MSIDDRQRAALHALDRFLGSDSTVRLSTRLISDSGSRGNKVNNDLNVAFRSFPRPHRQSVLALACHLLDRVYEPGADRRWTYEDDLGELLRRYDRGEDITERALKRAGAANLFNRVKKASGRGSTNRRPATWTTVAEDLLARRPDLDLRRVFRHAPPGVVPDADGRLRLAPELRDKAAEVEYLRRILRDRAESGLPVTRHAILRAPGLGRYFHRVVTRHGLSEIAFLAESTRLPAVELTHERSGARLYAVQHAHCIDRDGARMHHARLRSWSEALVDDALAHVLGDGYVDHHSHDVAIEDLLGPLPRDVYVGGPYSGKKSPTIDIVIGRRVCIEIINRLDRTDAGYAHKLRWKTKLLRRSRLPTFVVRVEVGRCDSLAVQVAEVACEIAGEIVVSPADLREWLERYQGALHRFASYEDASRRTRNLGIQSAAEYQRRRSEDTALPATPSTLYRGEGWIGWPEFLGKPRRRR
jgi:hypothetical protein